MIKVSEALKPKISRVLYAPFVLAVLWVCIPACGDEALHSERGPDLVASSEGTAGCAVSSPLGSGECCEVGRVVDGDTVVLDLFGLEVKVRLAEIDAPESRQEYGRESTALLESMVRGEEFEVVDLGRDRYGRMLAHLHGEEGCVNQRLIERGARFIATNPDATGPSVEGVLPATGAISALISKATGKEPYVVGKPNPMMFRSALNRIGAHSENTGMIGDRMDTDVVAGIEAGLHTVLVRTGISDDAEIERYPFRPDEILDSVAELLADHPIEAEMPEGEVTHGL